MYKEKQQLVVSAFLGESLKTQKATLLVRRPEGSSFFFRCRILKKVMASAINPNWSGPFEEGNFEAVSLHGGETIECVEGAVKLMDLASCLPWCLYSKPGPYQSRKLVHTDAGHTAYIALDRKGYLLRGEQYPTDWQAVRRADNTYQSKFAGASNR